jgi:hypothetical protein
MTDPDAFGSLTLREVNELFEEYMKFVNENRRGLGESSLRQTIDEFTEWAYGKGYRVWDFREHFYPKSSS